MASSAITLLIKRDLSLRFFRIILLWKEDSKVEEMNFDHIEDLEEIVTPGNGSAFCC